MIGSLKDIGNIPDLRKRLFFTLGMLAVYRFGVFVTTPGINIIKLRETFATQDGTLFGLVNMFSGGALENFSIFTLGLAPYISVSIIVQLMTPMIPSLERLRKEGDYGRRILTRYTRIGTILLALVQSYFIIAIGLESRPGLVEVPGMMFRLTTMMTLTAGTAFTMWLGEQITEKGLGNGSSIIIFTGILARMPSVLVGTLALARSGELSPFTVLFLMVFCLATIFAIVFVERSSRKVPVQYPRRTVGNQAIAANTQYMPLKLNMSGVIPPIFASALFALIATVGSFSKNEDVKDFVATYITPGVWSYELMFAALVIVFSFFYTAIIFNPEEVAENLKKNGGFIPSVRPGKQTIDYFYWLLNRITLWGALYIAAVCVIPQTVYFALGADSFAYVFGGTAILIVVGVTLDTASQIESILVARHYEAFMSQTSKMKGGVGNLGFARSRVFKR